MSSIGINTSENTYKILDLIGIGGMAEVHRCILSGQQGFEKLIVLKKLLSQVTQDSEVVTNFIDEARLAALLQHENVASVYDFGEMDGSYFIAMEYLFGQDLHTIMQRAREVGTPIVVEAALLIAQKICEGMEYAHSLKDLHGRPLNIIHRDLSPHNVFVTYDGKIKIIDFGVAKAEIFDNRTKVGVVKGKISYMSPEQLTDEKIDSRSDIFSIGILLYEMLSGTRMYRGDTASLIRQCMQVEYQALQELQPSLQPEIYALVNNALQKDLNNRYQSCAQMRDDIENCLYLMNKRPSTQVVKNYVRDLFVSEYETEKNNLFAETTKNAISLSDHDKTIIEENTVAFDTAGITTVIGERNEQKPNKKRWRRRHKIFFGSAAFVALIVFFLLYISGSIVPNEPDGLTGRPPQVLSGPAASPEPLPESVNEPEPQSSSKRAVEVASEPEQPMHFVEQAAFDDSENEVPALLVKAREAYDSNKLTLPADGSAYSYYQRVLEIDSGNNVAQDGIRQLSERYAEFAEMALATKDIVEATVQVNRGLSLAPGSGRLLSIQKRVVREKDDLVKKLVRKAKAAMSRNNLTTPAKTSAYRYYQDILKIDATNATALGGLRKIGDRYAALADDAFMNMNLKNARSYVRKGLKVVPNHKHLLDLQRDLTKSKASIFFKSLKKSVQPIFN